MKTSTKWNLKLLYKSDDDPQILKDRNEALAACKKFVTKWKENDEYLKDPKVLLEALKEYEDYIAIHGYLNKEGYYIGLRLSLETDNEKLRAMENKHHEIAVKIKNDLLFFTHKIAKIPAKDQKKFLNYKPLSNYKHSLETAFSMAKYLLSDAEEKILSLTSKTSNSNWVEMTSEFVSQETRRCADEKGKVEERNLGQLDTLTQSKNTKVRKAAASAINEILQKNSAVATKELNSILEYKKVVDELKGFKRPDEETHLGDDIDSSVVDSLIETVGKGFNTSQKYYQLKARLLKKKKIQYYERNTKVAEVKGKFPFEKSRELVLSTFKELDEEIFSVAKRFFDEGRIDVFPKKGKVGGAFSAGATIILPSYILLNHTDQVDDVTTIAHELGHGLNNEFTKRKQTEINYGHSTATAEVASTFFEDFILERIKKSADKQTRFALIMEKLNRDVSTIFRQTAAYMFELDLHKNFNEQGYLSTEAIGSLFKKHMQQYLGPSVDMEKGSENWWVYWMHFRNFFYVYTYASGLLISKSLQSMMRKNPKNIEKIKEFLSAGTNISPKELFLSLGIDISDANFWKNGLKEIENDLREAEKLAKELNLV